MAAQALEHVGVTYDWALAAVRAMNESTKAESPVAHLRSAPRVKRILETAARSHADGAKLYFHRASFARHHPRGRRRRDRRLEEDGRVGRQCSALNDLRGSRRPVAAGMPFFGGEQQSDASMLEEFGTDLTAKARDGKLDPASAAPPRSNASCRCFPRRQKNNPVADRRAGRGQDGGGRRARQSIVADQVPGYHSRKTPVCPTCRRCWQVRKYRGEFEERLKKVIKEVVKDGNVIPVHRRDAHHHRRRVGRRLDRCGGHPQPPLSRGEIQAIGATTVEEYRKHLEKDSALARRLVTIMVNEPNEEKSMRILDGLREPLRGAPSRALLR